MSEQDRSKEAERSRNNCKRTRENEQQADSAVDALTTALLEFFKSFLPDWLYSFIFDEDPDGPNESLEDMQPATAAEKKAQAQAVYNSGAVKKWETSKKEHTGGTVAHTSPVEGISKSSGFGWRIHPIYGDRRMHYGDDLTGGGNIMASADGVVLFAGKKGTYGQTVIIGHADGTRTLYAHMTGAKLPAIGEHVERGEVIGVMGKTGNSTGVHLHYEQIDANGRKHKPVINGVAAAIEHDHGEDGHNETLAKPKVAAVKPKVAKPQARADVEKPKAAAPQRDDSKFDVTDVTGGLNDVTASAKRAFSAATSKIGSWLS